jgi:O-antigen/teichoic acid export membrane protein
MEALRSRSIGRYPSASLARWRLALVAAPAAWRRKITGSTFASNVALMLAGTLLGQAASVLLSPVLTRLYTPDQFGWLSVYTAVLSILGVMAALGFDQAIPIAESIPELANLLAVSAVSLLGAVTLLSLATWLVPQFHSMVPWFGPLTNYSFLLPLGFLCLGGYYVMVAAATRLGAFRQIAQSRISQGLGGPISQIVLGLLGTGAPGLAVGFVIGQSSGTLMIASRVHRDAPELRSHVSWRGMIAVARRYAGFPLFASWSRLLDVAGGGTVLFLLFSACYSSEIAGYLFLIERVIARPLLVVSTSLLQVFTGEAGRAVRQEPAKFRRRFWQVVPQQFLLSAAWILVANLVAAWAFPLLFGQQWSATIPYLRAASAAYLALSVLHPVSNSLQILERQVLSASWQVGRLILVVGSVVFAWRLGYSALTALWISSIVQTLACLVMLGLIALSIERIQRRQSEPT